MNNKGAASSNQDIPGLPGNVEGPCVSPTRRSGKPGDGFVTSVASRFSSAFAFAFAHHSRLGLLWPVAWGLLPTTKI